MQFCTSSYIGQTRKHVPDVDLTAPLQASPVKSKMILILNGSVAYRACRLGLMFVLIFMIQRGICQTALGSAPDSIMQLGKWRIEYNLADGSADIFYGGE